MAEFRFYSTRDDWWMILEAILQSHDVRFAPDRWYSSADCTYYDAIDDAARNDIQKPRVFLVGDYSTAPLCLSRNPTIGLYSINVRRGGSAIDFVFPACYEKGGKWWMVSGDLHRYTKYWPASANVPVKATPAVKSAYEAIKQTIRSRLVRAKLMKEIWITPKALDLVESGDGSVGVDGWWVGRSPDGALTTIRDER